MYFEEDRDAGPAHRAEFSPIKIKEKFMRLQNWIDGLLKEYEEITGNEIVYKVSLQPRETLMDQHKKGLQEITQDLLRLFELLLKKDKIEVPWYSYDALLSGKFGPRMPFRLVMQKKIDPPIPRNTTPNFKPTRTVNLTSNKLYTKQLRELIQKYRSSQINSNGEVSFNTAQTE